MTSMQKPYVRLKRNWWENRTQSMRLQTSDVVRILDTQREFWSVFIIFRRLAHLGMVKSLSSLILNMRFQGGFLILSGYGALGF
ncbi:hypothetical protein CS542_09740 [Pedobacter sp. IW39]|nr:hypothetical protein CS542_09740 [Pedobacter sp. IW39]